MKEAVCLVGAGGHARSLIKLLEGGERRISGIYDGSFRSDSHETVGGYPLIGSTENISNQDLLVLAVGDNVKRGALFRNFSPNILKETLLHRCAHVESDVQLGMSNQLFGHTFLNAEASLGDNNIINTGAIIEHECRVGSHNHISVGAVLCGRVTLGDFCMIGAGTVIIDKIKVCSHVIVGANSTVIHDIVDPGTYVGSPARRIS